MGRDFKIEARSIRVALDAFHDFPRYAHS